jgi:hypothetical protein
MDNTTQEFARKIVAILEHIRDLLRARAPSEEHSNPIEKEANPHHKNASALLQSPIVPQVVPTPLQSRETDQRRYTPTPRWKTLIEVVALMAGVGYAVVTYFQWRDLRNNFVIDQRAWLGISFTIEPPFMNSQGKPLYLKDGEISNFAVQIQNFGRSIAKNLYGVVNFKILGTNEQLVPTYRARKPTDSATVLFPGAHLSIGTGNLETPIPQSIINEITGKAKTLYVFGLITYSDIFDMATPHHFLPVFGPQLSRVRRMFLLQRRRLTTAKLVGLSCHAKRAGDPNAQWGTGAPCSQLLIAKRTPCVGAAPQ